MCRADFYSHFGKKASQELLEGVADPCLRLMLDKNLSKYPPEEVYIFTAEELLKQNKSEKRKLNRRITKQRLNQLKLKNDAAIVLSRPSFTSGNQQHKVAQLLAYGPDRVSTELVYQGDNWSIQTILKTGKQKIGGYSMPITVTTAHLFAEYWRDREGKEAEDASLVAYDFIVDSRSNVKHDLSVENVVIQQKRPQSSEHVLALALRPAHAIKEMFKSMLLNDEIGKLLTSGSQKNEENSPGPVIRTYTLYRGFDGGPLQVGQTSIYVYLLMTRTMEVCSKLEDQDRFL
jgi:hypothetical protein